LGKEVIERFTSLLLDVFFADEIAVYAYSRTWAHHSLDGAQKI
jgi:hypothetical protein